MELKDLLLEESRRIKEQIVCWRREIHRHPEVGLALPHTAEIVERVLTQLGLEPKRTGGEGVTGITAVIQGGCPGPVILLRADMDALPMEEENHLPFRSEIPGAAHMCGHDTHTAMLLGAAALLTRFRQELRGNVKLMFQPGEEGYNGAGRMIEHGLLEEPRVDAAIAMHCLTGSRWKTGTVLCAVEGPAKASADAFRIDVRGRGTHGATPEQGVDVVDTLSQLVQGLYRIRSRELSAFTPAVLSVCQIHAGTVDNILPESGYITGTFRTFGETVRKLCRRRIEEIAGHTAAARGAEASVTFHGGLHPTLNDPALCPQVFSYVRELVGEENTDVIGPVTGAEDFSEISRRVPSVYLDISFGSGAEGYPEGVHSPRCLFNEEALPVGAACYAWCALRWLQDRGGQE